MDKHEAEQIAAAVNLIRGDWPTAQIVTILGRSHQHRPARDALMALVWCAYDPDTKTPARIDSEGPWWAAGRMAGADTDSRPGYLADARCPRHGQHEPCLHCQAEAAGPPASADTIRRIRAEAKTQHQGGPE